MAKKTTRSARQGGAGVREENGKQTADTPTASARETEQPRTVASTSDDHVRDGTKAKTNAGGASSECQVGIRTVLASKDKRQGKRAAAHHSNRTATQTGGVGARTKPCTQKKAALRTTPLRRSLRGRLQPVGRSDWTRHFSWCHAHRRAHRLRYRAKDWREARRVQGKVARRL